MFSKPRACLCGFHLTCYTPDKRHRGGTGLLGGIFITKSWPSLPSSSLCVLCTKASMIGSHSVASAPLPWLQCGSNRGPDLNWGWQREAVKTSWVASSPNVPLWKETYSESREVFWMYPVCTCLGISPTLLSISCFPSHLSSKITWPLARSLCFVLFLFFAFWQPVDVFSSPKVSRLHSRHVRLLLGAGKRAASTFFFPFF